MIIQTQRSRTARAVDAVLTLLAWAGFAYLIGNGTMLVLQGGLAGPAVPFWSKLLPTMNTLLVYVVVASVNGLLLLAWAQYNRVRFGGLDRRSRHGPLQDVTLAASFRVTQEQVAQLRRGRISAVHHSPDGHIVAIDTAQPRLYAVPGPHTADAA